MRKNAKKKSIKNTIPCTNIVCIDINRGTSHQRDTHMKLSQREWSATET